MCHLGQGTQDFSSNSSSLDVLDMLLFLDLLRVVGMIASITMFSPGKSGEIRNQ